ncbi:PASTA domain-containing protein [Actinoplanes sp. NPDC051494]|uniref:PASTA domain-containing protein n=1 Tax=Actinoplanes sp. NPDC051494 TaxID=3363907 RepID=UPI0037AE2CF1
MPVRTATRAGSAISAIVSSAPIAAEIARVTRQSPPVVRPMRPAVTAPNTVALAAIQVAQPRLPNQMLLSAAGVVGQTTTPRPYPSPSWAAPVPAATTAAAATCVVQPFSAMRGTVAVGDDACESMSEASRLAKLISWSRFREEGAAMSDETGEFFPFRDESEEDGANQPNGRTRKQDDATRIIPPAAPADATTVYRSVHNDDATSVWGEEENIWAGRAGVRAPRPGDDSIRTDWEPEPSGKWWTPILVGILAMVLLGLLGWGVYLIVQSTKDENGDSPLPVVSAAITPSPVQTPSVEASVSVAPATTEPSSAPVSSPSDIAIPALRGLSLDEARTALNRKGLNYRLRYVASTDAPPDTVIGSDPIEGQQVPGDTIINLIIASTPTAATTAPSSIAPTPSVVYDED